VGTAVISIVHNMLHNFNAIVAPYISISSPVLVETAHYVMLRPTLCRA